MVDRDQPGIRFDRSILMQFLSRKATTRGPKAPPSPLRGAGQTQTTG